MTDDRTTQEIIQTLGDDCDRCHKQLISAMDAVTTDVDGSVCVSTDYEFCARQLVRAFFAYIEAVTFSVKAWSAGYCMDNGIDITPQERYFATDTEYDLNDKGNVVEVTAKISLAKNVRFAIAMKRKAFGIVESFDAGVEWWSCFKQAVRIRDRLTHPKYPGDLDLSGDDIVMILKARRGFEDEMVKHSDPRERAEV